LLIPNLSIEFSFCYKAILIRRAR